MHRQWKIVVPRVVGDDALVEQCLMHGLNHFGSDARIFNCSDDANGRNNIHNKYVRGIDFLKNELKDEDVVIFCHNDVNFIDNFFKAKIETVFDETNIALLGVIGTKNLNESGCWWDNPPNILRGHIMQGSRDKAVGEGFHMIKGWVGFFDDVVAIDGLCMITLGKYLLRYNINFDAETFKGNHFYDLDLCMNFLTKGFKIGIADMLVYHKSQGESNQDESWVAEKNAFINKWKEKGIEFPVTVEKIDEWIKKNNISIPNVNTQPEIIEIEI